jgi:hypothetical protein
MLVFCCGACCIYSFLTDYKTTLGFLVMMLSHTSCMFGVNFLIIRKYLTFHFLSSALSLYNAYTNCLYVILSNKLLVLVSMLEL